MLDVAHPPPERGDGGGGVGAEAVGLVLFHVCAEYFSPLLHASTDAFISVVERESVSCVFSGNGGAILCARRRDVWSPVLGNRLQV